MNLKTIKTPNIDAVRTKTPYYLLALLGVLMDWTSTIIGVNLLTRTMGVRSLFETRISANPLLTLFGLLAVLLLTDMLSYGVMKGFDSDSATYAKYGDKRDVFRLMFEAVRIGIVTFAFIPSVLNMMLIGVPYV